MKPPRPLSYRPDIDGLRAIAVMAVVLYHAGLSAFGGGYVGVDVFFVISGYLITAILLREFKGGTYSTAHFYFRRVRRIFPALFVVTLFTMVVGFFLLFPPDYQRVGKAVRALSFFSSNHFFWQNSSDYWEQNTNALQPLLHTWSLAVEEQFYIVLPIILALVFRFSPRKEGALPQAMPYTLITLAVVSFIWGALRLEIDPSGAFYLLPSRAWEMLLGSVLAMVPGVRLKQIKPLWLNIAGVVGLALILWPVFAYTHSTKFPGLSALLPCWGAIFVLVAGSGSEKSIVSKLLSTRAFVIVGLMSYSLYLWHWPVFVFFRAPHWLLWGLDDLALWLPLPVTAVLTLLSWRFVEEPLRHWSAPKKVEARTLAFAAIALVAFSLAGRWVIKTANNKTMFTQPIPEALEKIVPPADKVPYQKWQASLDLTQIARDGGGHILGVSNGTPTFAVIGDSFAAMWGDSLDAWSKQKGATGIILARNGCPSLVALKARRMPSCDATTEARFEFLVNSSIKNIVLATAWKNVWPRGGEDYHGPYLPGIEGKSFGPDSLLDTTLYITIKRLKKAGKNIFVVNLVPGDPTDASPYFTTVKSIKTNGGPVYAPQAMVRNHPHRKEITETLSRQQVQHGFTLLDPESVLCNDDQCLLAVDGQPIYYDIGGHLTLFGGTKIISIFDPILGAP